MRRTNPNPALLLATIVLGILTIVFGLMALAPGSAPIKTGSVQRAAESNTEQDIKDVSSQFIENLLTYNHQTVEDDFERALRDATENFASTSQEALGTTVPEAKQQIKDNLSVSTGDVKGVAVTSRDSDTATVLVVATRTLHSKERQPTSGLVVIELSMLKTADGWKVDNAGNPATAE